MRREKTGMSFGKNKGGWRNLGFSRRTSTDSDFFESSPTGRSPEWEAKHKKDKGKKKHKHDRGIGVEMVDMHKQIESIGGKDDEGIKFGVTNPEHDRDGMPPR